MEEKEENPVLRLEKIYIYAPSRDLSHDVLMCPDEHAR